MWNYLYLFILIMFWKYWATEIQYSFYSIDHHSWFQPLKKINLHEKVMLLGSIKRHIKSRTKETFIRAFFRVNGSSWLEVSTCTWPLRIASFMACLLRWFIQLIPRILCERRRSCNIIISKQLIDTCLFNNF